MIADPTPQTERRASVLDDELSQDAPIAFPTVKPLGGQILGNQFFTNSPITPLSLWQVLASPEIYALTPGWFEGIRFAPFQEPFSANPGDKLWAKCKLKFAISNTTFAAQVGLGTETRTVYYKRGDYELKGAEVIITATGDPSPTNVLTPTSSETLATMDKDEVHHFLIGTVNADGTVTPGARSNFLVADTFLVAAITP